MKFLSQINVNTEYTLPMVDGTNGQVLSTDGNGVAYWGTISAGSLTLDGLSDVIITSPSTGQILRYGIPVGSGEVNPVWHNVTPNYLTTSSSIDALNDVVITTAAAGQILQYNGSNWVNATLSTVEYVSKVQHIIKAGVAITKGQAVYITGSDGTNMIAGLASNTSEGASSKVMGLAASTAAINAQIFVVTEGLLTGLNTSTATAGDPVWLGANGNLIFGLLNKPTSPAHLVYLGVVTRVQSNNGEIFVKVQNGIEIDEIHDVQISSPATGQLLRRDTDGYWKNWTPNFLTAEADTLATVTARGATTNGNIVVNGEISLPSYIRLTNAGVDNAFISESWGINLNGVSTHPVQVRGASFSVGYSLGAGTSYGSGNLFVSNKIGVNTTAPTKLLDVVGSGIVASFGGAFSPGSFAGIHFGYSETQYGSDNYKKSALVFERTDNHIGQGGNASGKIHFLLNNAGNSSATSLAHSAVTIDTNANGTAGTARVGIATTSPNSTLDVNGAANATSFSSTALLITNADTSGSLQPAQGDPANKIYSFRWQGNEGGYIDTDNKITFSGFKTPAGTSSQFLKANGTVDSSTYLTSTALNGYATQAWVNTNYYDRNQIDDFFGGAEAITGYNKSNWDAAYNDKINSASFNTTTGVLTLTQQDLGTVTVDLDGRYLESLPTATSTVLGGIKVGTNLSISNGVLSATDTDTVTSVGIDGDLSTGNIELRGGGATTITKSGGTITISSTDTDTNTTYSAGTGLTLTGTTFSVTSGTYAAASHNHDDRYYTETESDSRFVNASGDTMSGSLSFAAAAVIKKKITGVGDNPVKTASGVLASRSDNGGGATYYIIETNVPQDDYQMGGFTIELFGNYGDTNSKTKIDLGGYWNTEANGGFIGFEAHGTNPQYKPTIQVARNNNTGNTAFIISGVSWSYPVIVARDLWLGYSQTDGGSYGEGWVIASANNLDSYSNRDTVVWRNGYSDSNPAGYITGYTETDTLASVTGRGASTSNLITINSSDVGLKVQENGTSTTWRGRIGSFNSTADKSSFLGNYTGRAGVFGHNNALTAWDDLWVNTLGIYGQGNLYLSWNTYVKGNTTDTNYSIWHAGNFTDNSANWNTAYNDRISSAAVTGTTTKTLTLTQGDGGTVTATWTDYDTDNDAQQLTWTKATSSLTISNGNSVALEGLATEEFVTGQGYITGSYLPLSGGTLTGTLTMGTTGTQYIRMGRFPASTTNTGEAWIGRASDRNTGTMTVQLGGNSASSRSFEVVDYAWSVVLFSVGSNGNLTVSGTITENSSIRYKKDVVDIESTSSKVQLLRPVKYKKIRDESEEIGLIAEDVAELFPEVVKYDNEGRPDGVNYSRLSVILLKAVQELTERVNKLENK